MFVESIKYICTLKNKLNIIIIVDFKSSWPLQILINFKIWFLRQILCEIEPDIVQCYSKLFVNCV